MRTLVVCLTFYSACATGFLSAQQCPGSRVSQTCPGNRVSSREKSPLSSLRSSLTIPRASASSDEGLSKRGGAAEEGSVKKKVAGALGYLVTAGACITKLPQVKRIVDSGSVDGISLTSQYFETVSLTSKLVYHKLHEYPLSTWLENVALLVQQAIIIVLIWKMAVPAVSPVHVALAITAQSAYTMGALKLPEKFWPLLLVAKTVVTILSGGAQIKLNYLSQSTGQLAWSPVLLRIFGNTARMVTTLVFARKDLSLLFLYCTSAAIQIALGIQFIMYR
eukprot:CAMPEP_0172614180 /NCGR_PEP_ID=MMETSP1068-20121228/49250_1 /TAXON_ID=35684 /ORGANISM="Pseudopedinella elastica, Strain CCMP716" /LENGTH=277 /DNA_ID=CAMNT_0013418885 /DNA_START=128 /DNA_END=961 /DNA_ORIENTATION=+